MSYKIEIQFADGEHADCADVQGKSILQSAASAGLRLAYDCKQGQCQTCQLSLREGRVSYANRDKLTLTAAQEAEGVVLPCQGIADSDVRLVAPYTRASLLPVKQKTVEVVAVEEAGPGAISIRCRFGQHSKFEHLAGQYVRLGIPGLSDQRSYSMTTCASDWPEVGFLVRLIPGGSMSSQLAQLKPGAKVTVRGPHGNFYLRDGDEPLLWVAGGTGLAPFLSMLSALKHAGRTGGEIALCFGVNSVADSCWPQEMKDLLASFPRLKLTMAMMNPPPGWTGVAGSAVDALASVDLAAMASRGSRAYLCGPPPMVQAAKSKLFASGFDQADVLNEEFLPSEAA